jgi:hypothetical protein
VPTIEERLAAYRDVLDESVVEAPGGVLDTEPRSAGNRRGLLAVAAAAAVTVAGIVAIGGRDQAVAPLASVEPTAPTAPSTSPVAVTSAAPPATAEPEPTVASTTPASSSANDDATLAAALEPVTLLGSRALSDASQHARNALIGSCMRAAGFPYEPELIGVNTMAPGVSEVEDVRAWWTVTEANQALPGYRDAMEGPEGCLGVAFDRMYPDPAGRSDVLLGALRTDGYGDIRDRIFTDSEYLADLRGLAECLADRGYEVDASLADPERTNEQISEVWDALSSTADSVDPEMYEFLPELFEAIDAPKNAVCPTFSDVTRRSFNAADRRAADAWLAEHPELLEPIRVVMVDELRRFLQITESTDRLIGAVDVDGVVVEVTTRDGGTGLCGYFVGVGGGCDTIDPAVPATFVTVSTDADTQTVLYGFMPAGWTVWMEADGVRLDVAVSRDDGLGRVAIGASVPGAAEAERVELVQVDEAGSVRRTEVER